ncbi:MAG: Deoxyuridine 5'-triphosphate nucleotidohydrolase [Chlamydiales bacterium]|nr:Deoxyuridine 5'-triphosphate nucleotidohydrolase [Chlamydiales bacterium]MCH9619963.1 Deoxyuridine 5'-triphosphate nucleotidohydrolase [Chlamydiales bacterium]MCH9622610.1 Deoxyuridine 5'-triphosphate nucleotidohydrolase [Chlamydiales bacterium]
MNKVSIPTISEHEDLPSYATEGSAGADVYANVSEPFVINPADSALIPTGLSCEIPQGYEIQVRPRSGHALKAQVTILNGPGTIDSDYRGEIKVILINHGKKPFVVEPKMRIAQFVVAKVEQAHFVKVEEALTTTSRGSGGFGHTGVD